MVQHMVLGLGYNSGTIKLQTDLAESVARADVSILELLGQYEDFLRKSKADEKANPKLRDGLRSTGYTNSSLDIAVSEVAQVTNFYHTRAAAWSLYRQIICLCIGGAKKRREAELSGSSTKA